MAVNQQFWTMPGLSPAVRIEQPTEPGSARLFWDGARSEWSADAAARTPAVPDPALPGVYHVQVPSDRTASWPAKAYWFAALDPASGQVLQHWPVYVQGGDDGGLPTPSAGIPLPGGGKLQMWNAYVRPGS